MNAENIHAGNARARIEQRQNYKGWQAYRPTPFVHSFILSDVVVHCVFVARRLFAYLHLLGMCLSFSLENVYTNLINV